jgi:hypothetical protein
MYNQMKYEGLHGLEQDIDQAIEDNDVKRAVMLKHARNELAAKLGLNDKPSIQAPASRYELKSNQY